jgi:DNA-directed RNA polymerase specialized sigma24 family protein
MDDAEPITQWLDRLRAGDPSAAQPLWERYFVRLVQLARKQLEGVRRASADEEDVALSAFHSFCRAAEDGRFPDLRDRDELWRLLVVMTERKAIDQVRAQARLKRGGGRVVGESALDRSEAGAEAQGLASLPDREPTPSFAAELAEECQRLLGLLPNDGLRSIAMRKLEGHTNESIADALGIALRSVERKLSVIRAVWEGEAHR